VRVDLNELWPRDKGPCRFLLFFFSFFYLSFILALLHFPPLSLSLSSFVVTSNRYKSEVAIHVQSRERAKIRKRENLQMLEATLVLAWFWRCRTHLSSIKKKKKKTRNKNGIHCYLSFLPRTIFTYRTSNLPPSILMSCFYYFIMSLYRLISPEIPRNFRTHDGIRSGIDQSSKYFSMLVSPDLSVTIGNFACAPEGAERIVRFRSRDLPLFNLRSTFLLKSRRTKEARRVPNPGRSVRTQDALCSSPIARVNLARLSRRLFRRSQTRGDYTSANSKRQDYSLWPSLQMSKVWSQVHDACRNVARFATTNINRIITPKEERSRKDYEANDSLSLHGRCGEICNGNPSRSKANSKFEARKEKRAVGSREDAEATMRRKPHAFHGRDAAQKYETKKRKSHALHSGTISSDQSSARLYLLHRQSHRNS